MCYNNTIKLTHYIDIDWEPLFFTKRGHKVRPQILGVFGLFMAFISNSTYPAIGKDLTTAFSPLSLLFLSETLGATFVLMSFGLMPLLKDIRRLKVQEKFVLAIVSVLTGMIGPYLWFYALEYTTAVNTALFSRSGMLFMIFLSAIMLRETFTKNHALAVSIITLGIAFVALQGFTADFSINYGDVIIIASMFIYAVSGVMIKKYINGIHPQIIIFCRGVAAAWIFFTVEPFLSVNLGDELRSMSSSIFFALLSYGFISKFLGIYGFYQAINKLTVTTVSMVGSVSIVGSIMFANLYLGETIYWYQAVGGALIILGVMISHQVGISHNKKLHKHHLWHQHQHA